VRGQDVAAAQGGACWKAAVAGRGGRGFEAPGGGEGCAAPAGTAVEAIAVGRVVVGVGGSAVSREGKAQNNNNRTVSQQTG